MIANRVIVTSLLFLCNVDKNNDSNADILNCDIIKIIRIPNEVVNTLCGINDEFLRGYK